MENHGWPHKSHESNDHMVTEQTGVKIRHANDCAGSRPNELCINGLHAAASTTG